MILPRWKLPHFDAQDYFSSLIESLNDSDNAWTPDENDLVYDEDVVNEIDGDALESLYWGYRDPDYPEWFAYVGTDAFLPGHDPYNDDEAKARDLVARAKDDLRSRDIEDLLSSLQELLDVRGGVLPNSGWIPHQIDHWSGILDIPIPDDRRLDRIKEEVILAVRDLSTKLCMLIARNPSALDHVNWRQLEELVATALCSLGFHIELTRPSKDGGRDVIASCILKGKWTTYYIEIKHWRSGKRVGSREVFDFVQVNLADKTDGGLFLSTSDFAPDVYSDLCEIGRQRIRLANKEKIVLLCQRFSRRDFGLWRCVDELPKILFEKSINQL